MERLTRLATLTLMATCMLNSCSTQTSADQTSLSEHEPTPLPIMLEELTEAQQGIINNMNDQDTSSYFIDSRPVLFQIQGVKSNADETRFTQPIHRSVEVMIYTLCEAENGELVDYGWIENESGEVIWKAEYRNSVHGGGDARNRKIVDHITLPPDHYRLRFVSNGSHAVSDWEGAPPEREFYYGITVFNLKAIERIEKEIVDE